MGIRLAKNEAVPRGSVLILGSGPVALMIARRLRELGYVAFTYSDLDPDDPFPDPVDPNSISRLKTVLADFVERKDGQWIHPEAGVWAERPELYSLGNEFGLTVIGPGSKTVNLFANRLNFLVEAEQLGISNLVVNYDPIQSEREVRSIALKKGFPIVLKSITEGLGGFGIKVIQSREELRDELPLWIDQLRRAVGEAVFFAEGYVEAARKISVPFFRDADGDVSCFEMVDSSLESRQHKIIEFCPVEEVDEKVLQILAQETQKIAESLKYFGLGVLEFLVDGERVYLARGLPGLNSGFALWEKVSGISAVELQIAALNGKKQSHIKSQKERLWTSGLSIQIVAEDAFFQVPQPGKILESDWKSTYKSPFATAEFENICMVNSEVPVDSDGLIGLLTVGSPKRKTAVQFAIETLDQIWIAGSLQTNSRYIRELLSHPWVREGIFHASFVTEEFVPKLFPPQQICQTIASLCHSFSDGEGGAGSGDVRTLWAIGNHWISGEGIELDWLVPPSARKQPDGRSAWSGVLRETEGSDENSLRVHFFPLSDARWQVRLGSWSMVVRKVNRIVGTKSKSPARPSVGLRENQIYLYSQLGGRVHAVLKRSGSSVPAHEALLLVESLQTLVPHATPISVKVVRWMVSQGSAVSTGQPLAVLERIRA